MADWTTQVAAYLAEYEGLTRQRYATALVLFHTWYQTTYSAAPDAALLTSEEVREYRNALTGQKLQAATVNARLAPVRGLVRAQGREVRVKSVGRVTPAVETLTAREVGRLLAVLDGDDWQARRNVALATLLVRAGLRISEALALRLGQITLNARSGTCRVLGKGLKERTIPLGREVRESLAAYLAVRPAAAPTDLLFVSRTYQPLAARDVERQLAHAARQAGITQKVTPHLLRHTFATRFVREHGDIATLAQILGHTNIATTTRYLHPDAGRMQELMEEM